MGPFDHIQKKGSKAIKPLPAQIRRETTSQQIVATSSSRITPKNHKATVATITTLKSFKPDQSTKKRALPVHSRWGSESDDDDNINTTSDTSRKRPKTSSHDELDSGRQIYNQKAFMNSDDKLLIVHAAKIATIHSPKYKKAFPKNSRANQIHLRYPNASTSERYELVSPIQKDEFKPLEDIKEVLQVITSYYLPASEAAILNDDSHGLLRKLKRAAEKQAGDDYIELISHWNMKLETLVRNGTIGKILNELRCLDLKLVERILTQTYSRTVSLHVRDLSQYENGTDNVYGELLPKFISDILRKDTKLKSNQIFVDLGSGVGNVVLQAALEVGCESWGCEMMEKACNLAELQEKEFRARCQLWGLAAGKVHLEQGDFLKNAAIGSVLRKADVVLVNNQAFTPELNEDLISLFLDLKEGCLIVSLKSFVPSGHKITSRNLDNPCNILEVTEKRYFSGCVSWTDAPGTYYVSKKDRSKLSAIAERL